MNYEDRIHRVIDYIGKHFDEEELSLDALSKVACLSPFHFHRIFSALTGLSLQKYIRWLRLKRAAHQLHIDQKRSILDIALDAGFESHEAFTRAFKQACQMTPKDFRDQPNWKIWEETPYSFPKRKENKMEVTIKNIDRRRLAAIEHRGDLNKFGDSVNKLINWAKASPRNLDPQPGESFGFAYNDPATVPPEDFRFDLGMTVPKNVKPTGEIFERELPEGRYAVALHKGSRHKIGDTLYPLYRDWLPESGEELEDLPCIFRYINFDHEVAETELLTECCLLLKD